jgi:guanylate kinase
MKVFAISGPSGVGKGSVIKELLKRHPDYALSISYTTRQKRADEAEGRDYFFISDADFDKKIATGEFIEWAQVHGNRYGTTLAQLEKLKKNHRVVIVELDVQGAMNLKNRLNGSVSIFIEPPDFETLSKRLSGRQTETKEEMNLRMANAANEVALGKQFDYQVVNDDLHETAQKIADIITNQ